MKINWKKWFQIDKGNLLFAGLLILLAGIVILYLELLKPNIKTKDDLVFINGPFNEYTWIKGSSGKSGSRLTFSLQSYNKRFQIIADFYEILNKEKFKAIPQGEPITIAIAKSSEKDITTTKTLRVYSIASKKEIFLNYKDAIRKHNSPFLKIFSVLFILIGIGSTYSGYNWRRRKSLIRNS